MRIEIPEINKLHQRLAGEGFDSDGSLKKTNFVNLAGKYFHLDPPLMFGILDLERDHDSYSTGLELVAFKEKGEISKCEAFRGLSKVFADNFSRQEYNDGECFRPISEDGSGYILDQSGRATFAISPSIHRYHNEEEYPSREIVMGECGAMTRAFDLESSATFLKEMKLFQQIINLYIHSVYVLQKSKNSEFAYDPEKRIIIYPSLSDDSFDGF